MSDVSTHQTSPAKTRFVLFFDGTDNSAKSETNVYRLCQLTKKGDVGGVLQRPIYWEGVGVSRTRQLVEKISQRVGGSLFGIYSWRKLKEGYCCLRDEHKPDDEIYIFGFSRGAFSAMGLAGLLEWRGLPKPGVPDDVVDRHIEIYKKATRYSQEKCDPGGRSLRELMALSNAEKARLPREDKEVLECFRQVDIEFVGVFDTVRAYGLEPGWWLPWKTPKEVKVNDHTNSGRATLALRYTRHLPPNVIRAYHALAVDEHRAAFYPRVWVIPEKEQKPAGREVEQRWFIGAHANVGGGYVNDPLNKIPLQWMQEKASAQAGNVGVGNPRPGIEFKRIVSLVGTEYKDGTPVNSRRKHFYSAGSARPFRRPIWALEASVDKETNNEINSATIDPSVLKRIIDCDSYRPWNVEAFLRELRQVSHRGNKVSINDGVIQACLERFDATSRNSLHARLFGMFSNLWGRVRSVGSGLRRSLRV
jgi:Uncharacterized alpha/beta hydrolase domain (DUF2235)